MIPRSLLTAFLSGVFTLSPCLAQGDQAAEMGYRRTYVIQADAAWLGPGQVVAPAFVQISAGRIDWVATSDQRRERPSLVGAGSKPPLLKVEGTLAAGIVDAWTTFSPSDYAQDRQQDPARSVVDALPVQVPLADSSLVRQVLGAREAGVAAVHLAGGRQGLRRGQGSAAEFTALDLPLAVGTPTLDFAVGEGAASGPDASYQIEELVKQFDEAVDWRASWEDYDEAQKKYQEELAKYEEKFSKYLEEKQAAEKEAAAAGEDKAAEDGPKMPKRPKPPKEPVSTLARDLLLEAIDGKRQLRIEANQLEDIRALIDLKQRFDLKLVLLGGYDADRLAEELAAADIPVVLPVVPDHHAKAPRERSLSQRFARLHEAGVRLALASGGAEGAELLLLARAGELVADGQDEEVVWASLTTVPAELLGLEAYGRLGSGRSGTMVLFGGSSPFDASAPFKAHKPR